MIIEGVTFDATGTLFECPALAALYAETLKRHGVAITENEVERWFPVAWRELDCRVKLGGDRFADHPQGAKGFWESLVTRLCALAGHNQPSAFAVAELFHVFSRASSWRLFPEVETVLEELRATGLRLAVISNWDQRLEPLLEDFGLSQYFSAIITSAQVGHAKPDPRIFHAALKALELEPVQALHVGDDRLHDFEGAASAGLQAFLVNRAQGKDLSMAASRARAARL